LKFSKRRRAIPLRPIWTIMVAAKLDHSRVLVTKFHQNRSMLKGRSAGQRQTDTQTDRQTRMKIRARQVCNRAIKWHIDPSDRLATIPQRYRQDRQRSNSIGRTILQTVTQLKWAICHQLTSTCNSAYAFNHPQVRRGSKVLNKVTQPVG